MDYKKLINLVGESWADFLKPFMCPDAEGNCRYDALSAQLKEAYATSKVIPSQGLVFRAFKETPLESLRVVILGMDPYATPGTANGLAFATDQQELPVSLQLIYDAVEQDVYDGLDLAKGRRTGIPGKPMDDNTYKTWTEQGVMLLNAALTVKEGAPGSHLDLWKPFTEYIIDNLWRYKRNLIFIGWGNKAKALLHYHSVGTDSMGTDGMGTSQGVNIFHAAVIVAEHPEAAVKANRPWQTDSFSRTNLIMRINNYGSPIEW